MRYKVGLAQCDAQLGDVEANLATHAESIVLAAAEGVGLLVFPELSASGYLLQDMVSDVSMRAEDERFAALSSRAEGMSICVGGIEESPTHSQYISCFLLEGGAVRHVHRKAYLACYGVFDEARYVGSGNRFRAVDSAVGRIGLSICEDSWHPSAVELLLLDGADLIVVQAASPVRDLREGRLPQNAQTWMDTLRTYARLYGAYIAFCNRVGTEDGLVFWGNSILIGPEGDTVVEAPPYDAALVVGEVDTERVRQARLNNPVLRDERIDLTMRELDRIRGEQRRLGDA